MVGEKIINNILGKKIFCDNKSKNKRKDGKVSCDNCGRFVDERSLMFEDGKEYCRFCIND